MIMNKIFIEAKHQNTSEYHFIETLLQKFFPDTGYTISCIDGIGNLFSEAIVNQISLAQNSGDQVIVLADADTIAKGYGYAKRKQDIDNGMTAKGISFPYFLYPDNCSDGDVETLMLSTAQRNSHIVFFDCFEDYEKCVSGVKDSNGNPKYNAPDLKGKLHTYMSAQKLPRKLRDRLGRGDWLFEDINFWDLNVSDLDPLKSFLAANLK